LLIILTLIMKRRFNKLASILGCTNYVGNEVTLE
jgi:hypothetical protein